MRPLRIVGSGAVTPGGLTAAQTCAAIRAALSGFELMTLAEPLGAEQTVARIPSHWTLRRDPGDWIVNMAARAVRAAMEEALSDGADPARTALLLTPPESLRNHPCYRHVAPGHLMRRVIDAAGLELHPLSRALDGGAAAAAAALDRASALIAAGEVDHVILAGVDSLVTPEDLGRLSAANRLLDADNPKGFVPGEGAAAVALSGRGGRGACCAVLAAATATETDTATSDRYSQGHGLLAALRAATADGRGEPEVDFVISTVNGERYAFHEAILAHVRFYRTRRDFLPVVYPAMTVGDMGAASAALALVLARDAFESGYAPGRIAVAELASEGALRGAVILRGGQTQEG